MPFGDWLARVTDRPVFYFDERYTTIEAEHHLLDAGLTRQKRKALRDKLAAQIMLQSYLDAGCPEIEAAAAKLPGLDWRSDLVAALADRERKSPG